jgi:hypothetical protein
VIGFTVAAEVAFIVWTDELLRKIPPSLKGARALLGDGTFGIILAVVLVVSAAFASEAIRALLLPLRLGVGAALRPFAHDYRTPIGKAMWTLCHSAGDLAADIFAKNETIFDDMYRGWSLAVTASSDFYTVVEKNWPTVFDLARRTVSGFAGRDEDFWRFIYFGHVTQEQAFGEYIDSQVEVIQAGWLALSLMPGVALRVGGSASEIATTAIIAGAASLLLVPTYLRRKIALGMYLLYVNLTSFQFGETPEISDRDPDS